jgi:hypothetical protein
MNPIPSKPPRRHPVFVMSPHVMWLRIAPTPETAPGLTAAPCRQVEQHLEGRAESANAPVAPSTASVPSSHAVAANATAVDASLLARPPPGTSLKAA